MKLIRARAGYHGNLRPGSPAEFRRVGGSLDAKFLQRILRNQVVGPAGHAESRGSAGGALQESASRRNADIGADTVNREIVRAGALPMDAELAGIRAGRRSENRAGSEIDERLKASTVQRQILDKIAVHHRTYRSIRGVDMKIAGVYRHGFRDGAQAQREIFRNLILHAQNEVFLNQRLETPRTSAPSIRSATHPPQPNKPPAF